MQATLWANDSRLTASGATFSPCRTWRYVLWRQWADGRCLMVVGLNPSTADETQDDPTVRRCIALARREGYAGLWMTNLYAYRATQPQRLSVVPDPIGPDNVDWLAVAACAADAVVLAWGVHGAVVCPDGYIARVFAELRAAHDTLYCLGTTKAGAPRHPLYLPNATPLVPYEGQG